MDKTLKHFMPLVDFLADSLGDCTEVVLHDLTDWHQSVVAIRNGQISGREVGSPITDLSLDILKTANFEQLPYMANYQGYAKNGHRLKSSTFFIKNEDGRPVGMLCINSDFSSLSNAYEQLGAIVGALGLRENAGIQENFNMNVNELVQANIRRICPNIEDQVVRMSQKDKLELVEGLSDMGTFLVKGAIGCVAEHLRASVPTIYRYLNMLKK